MDFRLLFQVIVMDKRSVAFAGTLQEAKDNEKYNQLFSTSKDQTDGRRGSLLRQMSSNRTAMDNWTLLRNIRKVRPVNLCDSFEEASSRRSVS